MKQPQEEKRLEGELRDINKRHFADMGLEFNNSAGLWVARQQTKRGQRVGILRAGKIAPGDFWGRQARRRLRH
jgi:hypothetical protein